MNNDFVVYVRKNYEHLFSSSEVSPGRTKSLYNKEKHVEKCVIVVGFPRLLLFIDQLSVLHDKKSGNSMWPGQQTRNFDFIHFHSFSFISISTII